MSDYDINNAKNDIQNLQDQNKYDFQEIKRLDSLIKDYDKRILQAINFNNQINKKIQDDYEKFKKSIIDDNLDIGNGGNIVFRDVVDGEIFILDTDTTPTVTYGNIIISTSALTVKENTSATFTVKLDKQPTNSQSVNISVNNKNCTVNPKTLTFTNANYNQTQTITVHGVHDSSHYNDKISTINITSSNVASKSINVTITNVDEMPSELVNVQSVTLNKSTHTMKVDETLQLTPVITPSDATNQNVNWSTNNENCTVVGGLVTAIAEGECIITCTTVDQNKTAECTITVEAKTETVPFTNLLINSDTFITPSGFSNTYWQAYKGTKTIEKPGTCKYICTDTSTSPLPPLFKCDLSSHTTSNGLIEGHKYYHKHKYSSDGKNYTLYSRIVTSISTGFTVGTLLFNYTNLHETINIWVKDCIMIDLTEIYGSGSEPSKTECDTIYGDLWHA